MIKSSSFNQSLKRAVDGGKTVVEVLVNGLMRAAESVFVSSSRRGNRTRYQSGLHLLCKNERSFLRQLGWYRRINVLSQLWGKAFFVRIKQSNTAQGKERLKLCFYWLNDGASYYVINIFKIKTTF